MVIKREYVVFAIVLVGAIALYHEFGPRKVEIRTVVVEKETKEQEVQEKEVAKETEKRDTKEVRVIERVIEKPDGEKITEKVEETITERVDNVRKEERDRYSRMLEEKERSIREEYEEKTASGARKKRWHLSVGHNPAIGYSMGSLSYRLIGPFTIGVAGDTEFNTAFTVGITF